MIHLTESQWARLYKEITVIALRMTWTKNPKQQWTQRDRAQEAVQRACERLLRVKPPGLDSFEAVRRYLVGATRSELGHAYESAAARRDAEDAAGVDDATRRGEGRSAEEMQLEAARKRGEEERADVIMRRLRVALKGDRLALAQLDLIAMEVDSPEEQARTLRVKIEDVYGARKRRKRALDKIVEEYRAGGEDEEKT